MVICLERGADLHMAQLMPLPLTVSCFSKIQTGFTFLVPAHPVVPEKGPLNGCVCVCSVLCDHPDWRSVSENNTIKWSRPADLEYALVAQSVAISQAGGARRGRRAAVVSARVARQPASELVEDDHRVPLEVRDDDVAVQRAHRHVLGTLRHS